MTVTEVPRAAEQAVVTAREAGAFEGGPLICRDTFACADDEITSLHIEHIA